jgi:hypothetical protein
VLDSFSVRLPELTRTTTFRWTLVVGGIYALSIVLLFGVVYWRMEQYLTTRSDDVVTRQAETLAAAVPEKRLDAIDWLWSRIPAGFNTPVCSLPTGSGSPVTWREFLPTFRSTDRRSGP